MYASASCFISWHVVSFCLIVAFKGALSAEVLCLGVVSQMVFEASSV